MPLDDFPFELIDHVVSYLESQKGRNYHYSGVPDPKIHPYAVLSRSWKQAVEDRLFKQIRIDSDELPEFEALVAQHPSRLKNLCEVSFKPWLANYDAAARFRFERRADLAANNEAFSDSVVRLFQLLSPSDEVADAKPIALQLKQPDAPEHKQEGARVSDGLEKERHKHSCIDFIRSDDLARVDRVTELRYREEHYPQRHLAPSALVKMVAKLPNLQTIDWEYIDYQATFPDLRRRMRNDFAESLEALSCLDLSVFKLNDWNWRIEHRFLGYDVRNSDSLDTLSVAIGRFLRASKCKTIILEGPMCLDPGIFGDSGDIWLDVETFSLGVSPVRPDGHWYFAQEQELGVEVPNGPEYPRKFDDDLESDDTYESFLDYAEENDHVEYEMGRPPPEMPGQHQSHPYSGDTFPKRWFRTMPNASFEELLESAARAAARMSRLKSMWLHSPIHGCERTGGKNQEEVFDFLYIRAEIPNIYPRYERSYMMVHGSKGPPRGGKGKRKRDERYNRLYWRVPRGWRMSKTLETLWTTVLGENGIVRYEEW